MACRRLAISNPMLNALRSGQRAFLSFKTGRRTTVRGAAPIPGATPVSREVARGLSDGVTSKFGDPSFWEREYSSQFDSKQPLQPFEWFLPYEGGLRQHLLPFLESLPACKRVLNVGCGTSDVGPKLASEPGLHAHVTDVDSSSSAVRIMKARHLGLDKYSCDMADALNLPFPDGTFDAVVDKGTLDSLLCHSVEDAETMATEVHRVLAKGGVFLQVTAEDPDARLDLLTKRGGQMHEPWTRSIFKEIGEGEHSTYFMYILEK